MNFFSWFWAFCIVTGFLYTALMVWFLNGWKSIPLFICKNKVFNTKVSILVPFYNEATTLKACIDSLVHQNIQTTELEIILIDDQSTDQSTSIAKKYAKQYRRVRYELNTRNKGKKQSLLHGIDSSKGELIVTTDADCIYSEFWIANFVEYFELYEPNMIVGPVFLKTGKSLFQKFQQLEFISLIASGAGAIGINHPVMCNGANLAFSKLAFMQLKDPFNIKYSSGDDVFLLHSMKKLDAEKIHFIKSKEAAVITSSASSIKDFFKQRFRWVSKTPGYTDSDTKFTAFVVFASSFLWVLGLGLMVYNIEFWKPLLFLFIVKTLIDMLFLNGVSSYFKQKKLLKWIPIFEIFYGFYVTATAMSILFKKKNANS